MIVFLAGKPPYRGVKRVLMGPDEYLYGEEQCVPQLREDMPEEAVDEVVGVFKKHLAAFPTKGFEG